MNEFLLSQLIVGVAFIVGSIAFLLSERKHILRALFITAILIGLHFVVLKEYTAAFFLGVSALRFFVASISTNKKWLYVFLSFAVANIALTYTSPVNILSFLAILIATVGSFQANVMVVRASMATASLFWIAHNLIIWTPVAMVMESTFLIFNVMGYYREHNRHQDSELKRS